jgi:hypothetical protein
MRMEQSQRSETSAHKIQTSGHHPKERIRHSKQSKSMKSECYFCYEHGKVLKPTTVQDQDLKHINKILFH